MRIRTEPAEGAHQGVSLGALIVLAIGFRLSALFLLRYGGATPDWSDFRYYHELASLSAQGYLPDVHFWVEYPPLFPWLAVAAYQLSLLIPSWIHPYFWFDLFLTAVLALGDAGSIVLIDRLGASVGGRGRGRSSATIYAAMFLPTYAALGWFDTLPTFFLLLGLWASVRALEASGHRVVGLAVLAGGALGIGAMLKLFPLVALPALLLGFGPRLGARAPVAPASKADQPPGRPGRVWLSAIGVGTTGATMAAIALPFLWRSPETFLATFRNVLARGSWMSPWALLDGYTGTGGVAALNDRLFYNASALWGQPSHLGAIWAAVGVVGALVFAERWLAAARARTPRALIALTGFGITLLLLISRGFSTQFTLWALPFVALLLPGLDGALLATLLTLNNVVLEGYLYVTLFPTLASLLWISVGLRTALLLWLAFETAMAVAPSIGRRADQLRRLAVRPAVALATIAALVALFRLAPAMQAAMLARTGDAAVVAALRQSDPSAAVVFTQSAAFDRLEGYLRPRPSILVATPGLLQWTGDRSLYHRLDVALGDRPVVELVTDPTQPTPAVLPAVRDWLGAHYGAGPEQKLGSVIVQEFSRARLPSERTLGVQFGGAMALRGVRPAELAIPLTTGPAGPLALTLDWQATAPIERDYTVSVQLIDERGKLIAQHDAMPANNTLPTTRWRPGEAIADPVQLALPGALAPGRYQLIVVVYDSQTLARLPVRGAGQAGDYATIGPVVVDRSANGQ